MRTSNFVAFALPLALAMAVAGCGSKKADEVGQVDASMNDEPGVQEGAVTAAQARSEAAALAGRLASGKLANAEAAVALEDLDRLVNDNIVEFPEAIRPELTQCIQSARASLESGDMKGVKQAAIEIQSFISEPAGASTAASATTEAG